MNKEQLIEGQWYEAKRDDRWLFKYKKNRNGGIHGSDTEFSKCINLTNKFKSFNNWIGDNSQYIISKVTNIEEVYEYFPEEKPVITKVKPKIGDYISVEGSKDLLGRKMIAKITGPFIGDDRGTRASCMLISNFNSPCSSDFYFNKNGGICYQSENRVWRYSTQEEQEWLNACIKADNFIPKEEALKKTELPTYEYVECLKDHPDQFTKGKIYKNSRTGRSGSVDEDDKGDKNAWHSDYFKPSTKQAFDAQNMYTRIQHNTIERENIFLYPLTPKESYYIGVDPYEKEQVISSPKLKRKSSHKQINTKINKITSISTNLSKTTKNQLINI